MLKLIERLGPIDEGTASDTLTLPFELRIRGRLKAESDSGQPLGLFLDRGPGAARWRRLESGKWRDRAHLGPPLNPW